MALPSGLRVDIEFTAGVWTDVSTYVSLRQGVSLKFGRTDSASAPQVATASLRLDNFDGRFTPKSSGSPYYPNVVPRKRLRVSYNSGSSPRFVGYIKQWLPVMDGDQHYVVVQATDRLDVLSRSALFDAHTYAMRALSPSVWMRCDDGGSFTVGTAGGATVGTLLDAVTGTLVAVQNNFSTADVILGPDTTPVTVNGTGSISADVGSGSGAGISFSLPTQVSTSAFTYLAWVYLDAPLTSGASVSVKVDSGTGNPVHESDFAFSTAAGTGVTTVAGGSNFGATLGTGIVSTPTSSAAAVATPHLIAVTGATGSSTASLYLDGTLVGTTTGSGQNTQTLIAAYLFVSNSGSGNATARISDFALFSRQLSAGEILDLYNAGGAGYAGELSGARITRILGYAGLGVSDYNIATGSIPMGDARINGVSVTQAIQDVAETESGGAAVFVDVDGKVRFTDSAYRSSATPVMTLDAEGDLDDGSWQPVFDDLERVNDVTASRDGGASVRATDAVSIAALGTVAEDTTVNVYADEYLLPWAQWRLNSTTPQFRIPQVAVDLMTAQTAGLYTALASTTIGSIVRVSGLPATTTNPVAGGTAQVLPTTYVDGYVEGWSEQITADSYMVTFDLSPYIPRHIIANTTWGRLVETTGTMTLTSTIASGASSMSLTTSGSNPTLSTSAGDYPLYLKIDEEIVSVSSAPAGSASPQTLTITRAQLGTIAAAHTAGATVNVLAGALTI